MSEPSSETKTFSLRTILSSTTGYLITESKGTGEHRDNGIGDMYELLGWMTNDSPFTHQLGRFSRECNPWLVEWFPELASCGTTERTESLEGLINLDEANDKEESIRSWIIETRERFPDVKDSYDVPRIPKGNHVPRDPIAELIEMRAVVVEEK